MNYKTTALSIFRVMIRIALTLIWLLIIFLPLCITWQLRLSKLNGRIRMIAFTVGSILWGLRIHKRGTLAKDRPLLVVSNHFSYLDVFALGSIIPARFTPKSEIASWPVIGFVCKIGGCIFINRRNSGILHDKSELDYAASTGEVISLFPESTTNEGVKLLPFKSSFFSIVENKPIAVQPITLLYTHLNGKPLDAISRPQVGWYGDAEFFPHLLQFLGQRSADVTLIFHEVVMGNKFESRKELALYCKEVVEVPFVALQYDQKL